MEKNRPEIDGGLYEDSVPRSTTSLLLQPLPFNIFELSLLVEGT
jgi:hypothetical protein